MAYDEELTDRFRVATDGLVGIREQKMMGGVCFMLNGNMLGGAHREKSGDGRFMFRVGKELQAEALQRPGARIMMQGQRRMTSLVFVDEAACDDAALRDWISFALTFVGSLPAK